MIPILYKSSESSFTSNGLGRLLDCISCKVTEERNGIYECDFEYPVSGTHYSEIYPGRIIGVTHDDTGDVQPFDIVSYSRPINGVVTFHAVHISYRLTGQVVWSTSIMNSDVALNLFGNVSGTPFNYYADFSVGNTYMAAADGVPRTVRQMLGGMEGSFLDSYGGEIEWNKWNVNIYKARGVARNLVIRYGFNMSDYSEDTDYQGTYTSCVPYWTGNVDGKDVIVRGARVDADMTSYNGRRVCIPLDLTDKFDTQPTSAQLGAMALQVMNGNNTNLPAQSVTVNFVRLQDDPEYQDLAGLMACRLCDTIGVVFPKYGMSGRFKIVKTVFDVLKERYEEMELGTPSTTFAEALGITEVPTKSETTANLAISGDLTVGGTATITGSVSADSLTLAGHNSPIGALAGDTASKTLSGVTASTSWQEVSNVSLTPGMWLIKGWASFNGSTAGVRYIYITTNSAPSSSVVAAVGNFSQYMAANAHGLVSGFYIADVASTTTLRLFVKTTAGTPAVPYCQLEAIRIR